jgi:hypothetical protein
VTSSTINWLSNTTMLCSIPLGFIASWALDTRGIRFSVGGTRVDGVSRSFCADSCCWAAG